MPSAAAFAASLARGVAIVRRRSLGFAELGEFLIGTDEKDLELPVMLEPPQPDSGIRRVARQRRAVSEPAHVVRRIDVLQKERPSNRSNPRQIDQRRKRSLPLGGNGI